MDTNEIIDRLNNLQAENFALMHLIAALVAHSNTDLRNEYAARCGIFRIVTEPNMDGDARRIQRDAFTRIGRTVLGDHNAVQRK